MGERLAFFGCGTFVKVQYMEIFSVFCGLFYMRIKGHDFRPNLVPKKVP